MLPKPLKLALSTALGVGLLVISADGVLYHGWGEGLVRLGAVGVGLLHAGRQTTPTPSARIVEPAPPAERPLWLSNDPAVFVVDVRNALANASLDDEPARREAAFDGVLDRTIDYAKLTRRAFGEPCPPSRPDCVDLWATLDAGQQREMEGLIQSLIRARYGRGSATVAGYDVRVRGVQEGSEGMRVRTSATNAKQARDLDIWIDVVLDRRADGLRVTDFSFEGSSLTKNYYEQFALCLGDPARGYPALAAKLRAKIAKLSASG